MSNGLDQDQDGHYIGPDPGPNCKQKFLADDKSRLLSGQSVARHTFVFHCVIISSDQK